VKKIKFLEYLDKRKWKVKRRIKTRKYFIEIPKVFSMTENTEQTIKVLKNILMYKEFLTKKLPLFIDWTHCQEMDLAASTILTLIILNILVISKTGLRSEGKISNTGKINDLLFKNSLFKYQGLGNPVSEGIVDKKENIEILQLIAGGETELEFRHIDHIAKEINFDYLFDCCGYISDFFGECLKKSNCSLNKNGINAVNGLVGEILTNLKEHLGKRFSQYYIIGFYKKINNIGKANLVFINFGDTFYEGLKENSTPDMLKLLKDYSKTYIKENKKFSEKFTEEMFWTLLALQVSVSRKYTIESAEIRGTGTVSVLDFFFDLKDNDNCLSKLTLISGNTKIQFDISDKKYYNDNMLIFNNEKNILKQQNEKNIMNIVEFFPGTIISLDFTLKSSWINKGE